MFIAVFNLPVCFVNSLGCNFTYCSAVKNVFHTLHVASESQGECFLSIAKDAIFSFCIKKSGVINKQ